MVSLVHDYPSCLDRVLDVSQQRNAPSAKGPTIHHRSISLDLTHKIERRASPSVEHRVVFHRNNCSLDSVEGRATLRQDARSEERRVGKEWRGWMTTSQS